MKNVAVHFSMFQFTDGAPYDEALRGQEGTSPDFEGSKLFWQHKGNPHNDESVYAQINLLSPLTD